MDVVLFRGMEWSDLVLLIDMGKWSASDALS